MSCLGNVRFSVVEHIPSVAILICFHCSLLNCLTFYSLLAITSSITVPLLDKADKESV